MGNQRGVPFIDVDTQIEKLDTLAVAGERK